MFALEGSASTSLSTVFSETAQQVYKSVATRVESFESEVSITGEEERQVAQGTRVEVVKRLRVFFTPIDMEFYRDQDANGLADLGLEANTVENRYNVVGEILMRSRAIE